MLDFVIYQCYYNSVGKRHKKGVNDMKITVKAARVNAGISQKEAAKQLSISLTAYNRKENGRAKFYADELYKLAEMFGIDIDIFFELGCRKKTRQNTA